MTSISRVYTKGMDFLIDYGQRHCHPINAILHLAGVPMAFYGMYRLVTGFGLEGLCELVGGYFLQYVGHKVQGNEVGEVTLIKHIWRRIRRAGS